MRIAIIALALIAAPASANEIVVDGDRLPCSYTQLAQGDNAGAIAALSSERSDPSRLINLGTAYARTGERAKAEAAYEAARASDVRYDLELADGRWMDSKAAARLALARLANGGTLLASR